MRSKEENTFLVAFGKRITELRTKKGFSIMELKDRAGISRAQLYRIESGQTNVSLIKLKSLADALEVSLAEVLDY